MKWKQLHQTKWDADILLSSAIFTSYVASINENGLMFDKMFSIVYIIYGGAINPKCFLEKNKIISNDNGYNDVNVKWRDKKKNKIKKFVQ